MRRLLADKLVFATAEIVIELAALFALLRVAGNPSWASTERSARAAWAGILHRDLR